MDSLSPDQFGIAGAENMDSAPVTLTCKEIVAQYCADNTDKCVQTASGMAIGPDSYEHFNQSYPECKDYQPTPISSLNTTTMNNKDLFNIKSPNFLGGENVHNLILIVLALLILVSVAGGNILTAPLKAAKKAV